MKEQPKKGNATGGGDFNDNEMKDDEGSDEDDELYDEKVKGSQEERKESPKKGQIVDKF